MHITILASGTRGDVQPYVALGKGLKQVGHQVQLATHANFETLVRSHGLDFALVEGNPRQILESEAGQIWLESGQNSLRFVRQMADLSRPLMRQASTDFWQACQSTDAIIFSALGIAGHSIAEKLKIPCFAAWLQPMARTRAFPSPMAHPKLRLGRTYNWLTHLMAEQMSWQPFRKMINQWRQDVLQLPPFPWQGLFDRFQQEKLPILYGYSPSVLPKPPDWPDWLTVTGYWFLDQSTEWRPPADLVQFLKAGSPPIYIGFGSMTSRNSERLVEITTEALAQTGRRGILLMGWGGLGNDTVQQALSNDLFVIESVPHDWLFPQMAAIVHHGGAGTTAAGLRAGIPSIIVPFFADQPFWGQRVAELGVGPPPIPYKRLSASRLAEAIRIATSDETMQAQAAALGQQIRAEDGIARAVEAIERHLEESNSLIPR